jgi:hypothetical protein
MLGNAEITVVEPVLSLLTSLELQVQYVHFFVRLGLGKLSTAAEPTTLKSACDRLCVQLVFSTCINALVVHVQVDWGGGGWGYQVWCSGGTL